MSAHRAGKMELTLERARELKTVGGVLDFLHLDSATPFVDQALRALGADTTMNPEFLARVLDAEIETVIDKVTDPTIAQKAMIRSFFHACRVVGGVAPAAASLRVVGNQSAADGRKIKLTTVLSQTIDSEAEVMGIDDVTIAYAKYEAVFGSGVRPPPDAEPTVDQLSGLAHLLKSGSAPYLDFAVWGPHGHRIMRRLRLAGMQFSGNGELRQVELTGPPDFELWLSSYRLLETAFIMLDAADLGPLQRYRDLLSGYHRRYGPSVWHILYQADTRMRLEQMDRLLRTARSAREVPGGMSPLDLKRPWNHVWTLAVEDIQWWRYELEEPALLILNKSSAARELVGDDARTGSQHNVVASQGRGPSAPQTTGGFASKRAARPGGPETSDGRYVRNRNGYAICDGFNTGSCSDTVRGIWCPKNRDQTHQCSRCLGTHPASACSHPSIPEGKRRRKGDGKGKTKSERHT